MLETELTPSDDLWLSSVEAPQIINDPNLFQWDDHADMVIAGIGGAGIAVANEALDQGFSVIGIDKTSGGGATAKSGGVFYAGGGTPIQKAAGIEDSPENMFNYLIQETGDIIKASTLVQSILFSYNISHSPPSISILILFAFVSFNIFENFCDLTIIVPLPLVGIIV